MPHHLRGVIGIAVSRADDAATHIRDHLLDRGTWERYEDDRPDPDGGGTVYRTEGFELREFDGLHIHLTGVAGAFTDPSLIVFPSRHSGETGRLLTTHFTGNFGQAEFGGTAGSFARACPNAHKRVRRLLADTAPDGYDVGIECTHHGPSDIDVPAMFVEIGSSSTEWHDAAAADAVARSILALRGVRPDTDRAIVGFGGGHYAPRFDRIVRETDWAVGHIGADWSLESMDSLASDVIRQAFEKSNADRAVIDGDRPALVSVIDDLGYRVVSETWVRETDGVALDLVAAAEETLSPIDEGLRFGEAAAGAREFTVYNPDPNLLADANAESVDRVRETVSNHAVAFEAGERGNRITGRIAVRGDGRDRVIDGLIAIIREGYDTVTRHGDTLIAEKHRFDPEQARRHGVPEGPAFGRLANGQSVDVNGETITPDMVHTKRTTRYQL